MAGRQIEFENYTKGFLERMGFVDVRGGDSFQVGDVRVNACGGHEETLIVIWCRSAGKRVGRSLNKDILELRGSMPTLTKSLRQGHEYSKYRKLKLVLATKNIELDEKDKEFATKVNPKVYIWDEPLIDYYSDLTKTVGEYARFSLLSEMDVEPRIKTLASVPALKAKLGKYPVYWFFVEPQKLLRIAYVARREIGNERYYQRILKRDRINKIQGFLHKHGIFPNNIIVSFTKAPKFAPLRQDWLDWPAWLEFGVITFPETYRACWIIDGQHRLYAFSDPKLAAQPKVAVLAFEKLSNEKQAQFFVEINKEQKPVDPDLLWDLEGDMRPTSSEGIISNIVKKLAETAIFMDRIYIPLRGRKKWGQLKFSGICMAIAGCKLSERVTKTMLGAGTNPLWQKDPNRVIQRVTAALDAYFGVVSSIFTGEQKSMIVFKSTSIVLFIEMFERILATLGQVPKGEELQKYVSAFQKAVQDNYPNSSELKRLLERCASRGGRAEVMRELAIKIRDFTGDKNFGGKIVVPRDEEELTKFERSLASFVVSKLGVHSLDDLRKVASKDLCGRVLSRKTTTIDEALTLGECRDIILLAGNWFTFESVFLIGPARFENRERVEVALGEVTSYRNKIKHGRQGQIRFNEPEICRLHMEQFGKCAEI